MDASAKHVVIVGGPEAREELLAIVLGKGEEAVPLFDSAAEARTFLASTGDFGEGWRAREVSARELVELLEYQGDEVRYVALSPPPEDLEGGMELNVVEREVLVGLLERRTSVRVPERGFWRRLFGR